MNQSETLLRFEKSIQLLHDYRSTALQNWIVSGSPGRYLLAYVPEVGYSHPHSIELSEGTVRVQRCSIAGVAQDGAAPIFQEKLSNEMDQAEVDTIVLGLVRKSLGNIESFMLFDQPRE